MAQAAEQPVEVALADLAAVEPPADRQRHGQDRVAEGILARLLARLLHQIEQVALEILGVAGCRGVALVPVHRRVAPF